MSGIYKCRETTGRDRTLAALDAILSIADRRCTRNKAISVCVRRDLTRIFFTPALTEENTILLSRLTICKDPEKIFGTEMAIQMCYVVLIVTMLVSACLEANAQDWTSNLTRDINAMTRRIEEQVQQLTANINAQVQNSLRPALAEVDRAIENLPRDAHGRIITSGNVIANGGNVVSITSENGMSRIIMSGRKPDGEPYVRTIVERTDGNILYHKEISFNPKTNVTENINWKLDLANPNAKPEIITDEK